MRGNRLPRDREGRALLPPREPPEEVARVDRKTMGQVLEACGARAPCQRILPAKDLRPVIPQCPVNPWRQVAGRWTAWSEHGENRAEPQTAFN
jgi:hypothetical protein